MQAPELIRKGESLALFRNLRRYTSSEAASVNAYVRLFENVSPWKTWIEDTLRDLLEVPSGRKLEITQSSELHSEQTQKYTFEKKEISIGRSSENDISLPMRSISRQHARITEREDGFYIQDLESASGTYVNRQRLEPAHACRLASGDEVLIFPYVLRVDPQEMWARDNEVELTYSCRFSPAAASGFFSRRGADLCLFQVRIHPEMGDAVLALGRPFLKTILSRLMREAISEFAESDSSLLEFVVVSILERANRELQFPFQCLLVPSQKFTIRDEPGVTLEASMHLAHAQGSILLFLPNNCLQKLQTAGARGLPAGTKEKIAWKVMVRIGYVDLDAGDLEDLRLDDTLLYVPEVELVLPGCSDGRTPEQGWRAVRDEENPHSFEVKEFFERSARMEENESPQDEVEKIGEVELGGLPIRIHVVLSQVEMSLKNLEGLTDGSIIELDEENPGTVQLVSNGEVLGMGDLVEIDDRLGVQITRWRKG